MKSSINKIVLCSIIAVLLLYPVLGVLNDAEYYYSFNNADLTGSDPNDLSGNGNNATTESGTVTGITGVLDEAFYYDGGVNSYVDINDYSIPAAWSTSYWYKSNSTGVTVYGVLGGTNSTSDYYGYYHSSGTIYTQDINWAATWNDTSFHHYVLTYDSADYELWVDGVSYGNKTSSQANTIMTIAQSRSINSHLKGVVDELGIWSRVLTNTEIAQLYNSGVGYDPYSSGNLTISAKDFYDNSTITAFNASVTFNGSTTNYSTNATFIVTTIPQGNLANVSVVATNYFVNTTVNLNTTTPYQATLTKYTVVAANISFNTTTIDVFAVNYTNQANSSDTGSVSTSTGVVYIPLYDGVYTVTVYDAVHAGIPYNSESVNATASSYLESITFLLDLSNTFNITLRDEINNSQHTGNITAYLEFISDNYAANYTTNNGSLNVSLLVPDDYTIRYWIDPDVPREYYVTLTNQSFKDIVLYTLDENKSAFFLPTVTDSNDEACAANKVSLLRYYLDINGYRVVEMAQTDTNGQAVLFVEPNIVNYKLSFSGDCGTFTSAPQKIVDQTQGFTVINGSSYLTSPIAIQNAAIAAYYVNATKTYVFDWNDPENIVTQGCIYVYRHYQGVTTTNYTACSSSNVGSLIYTLTGNLTDTEWSSQGILLTNTEFSTYTYRNEDVSFLTAVAVWGIAGVFWALILILGLILANAHSPSGIVFSSIGMLALLISVGMIAGGGGVIIGVVILGVVILYKMKY